MNPQEIELNAPPVFDIGEKVQLTKTIRNDGTFPGRELREILARKGDVGYVVAIGTFLQSFYVYSVHFLDLGIVVGCRASELTSLEGEKS